MGYHGSNDGTPTDAAALQSGEGDGNPHAALKGCTMCEPEGCGDGVFRRHRPWATAGTLHYNPTDRLEWEDTAEHAAVGRACLIECDFAMIGRRGSVATERGPPSRRKSAIAPQVISMMPHLIPIAPRVPHMMRHVIPRTAQSHSRGTYSLPPLPKGTASVASRRAAQSFLNLNP